MIGISIVGVDDVGKALSELSKKIQKDIGLKAVTAALTPMEEAARRLVTVDTGNLKNSIGLKTKTYKGGRNIFGIVGARSGFRGPDGRLAHKYAHLVEYGHAKKGGGTVAAKPFMRPAFEQTKGQMQTTLGVVLGQEIQIAAQRVARKRKK